MNRNCLIRQANRFSIFVFEIWWACVDLNHQPHPYQLSSSNVVRLATICYRVDSPRHYRQFTLLLQLPVATSFEGGWAQNWPHRIGGRPVVRLSKWAITWTPSPARPLF
jgi:hypothetical protein